jgi:hypothetical protein
VEPAGLLLAAGVGLHPVGIGDLRPVGQHPGEGLEAQALGLTHQHLLVSGHGLLGGRGAGSGQRGDLGLAHRPGQPRRLGGRQVAKRPAQAHRRRADDEGSWQRAATQAAPVRAPSAAHSPPASNAAVARVVAASRRARHRCSSTTDSPSARA